MNIDLNTLTSDQITELEKLIEYNKKADKIVKDFYDYVTLDFRSFKNGVFLVWGDSNNKKYIKIIDNRPILQCRFLHETYDVVVEKDCILNYLKSNYRGLAHLTSMIDAVKRDRGVTSGN